MAGPDISAKRNASCPDRAPSNDLLAAEPLVSRYT
jgi:hypothetical protein